MTTAVQMLQARGLIQALRGSIKVLDRAGLETCADGTYGSPEAEYDRLVGVSFRRVALKSTRPSA
ncbi:hypothetical protein SAMN04488020_1091 [Palleronia marisminoris]|nr:hypothetical protein SAMN04488020_1091 [Palleronia marisminoris]